MVSRGSRLMAQLTDDCFAFSGPLLPVDDMERIIARACRAGRARSRTVALAAARGRIAGARCRRRRSTCRRSTIPPSTATPCATPISPPTGETRLAVADRVTAGQCGRRTVAAGQRGPHLHRRADAGRRRHGVHAGGRAARTAASVHPAARPQAAAPTGGLAGEDIRAGAIALPAGRRLSAAGRRARRRARP